MQGVHAAAGAGFRCRASIAAGRWQPVQDDAPGNGTRAAVCRRAPDAWRMTADTKKPACAGLIC